jgi:hypothetical protein
MYGSSSRQIMSNQNMQTQCNDTSMTISEMDLSVIPGSTATSSSPLILKSQSNDIYGNNVVAPLRTHSSKFPVRIYLIIQGLPYIHHTTFFKERWVWNYIFCGLFIREKMT